MLVLPDEEGPGVLLATRSSRSLLVGSTSVPVPPLPPDARAALSSGRLIDADGRRRSGRDPSRTWRPVRTSSPASGIERLLVAHHGEGHSVGALSERTPDHASMLSAREQIRGVTGEVEMALT